MKVQARTMPIRVAKARLSEAVDASQGSYVLVTRHGRPAALIVGVEGTDLTEVVRLGDSMCRQKNR